MYSLGLLSATLLVIIFCSCKILTVFADNETAALDIIQKLSNRQREVASYPDSLAALLSTTFKSHKKFADAYSAHLCFDNFKNEMDEIIAKFGVAHNNCLAQEVKHLNILDQHYQPTLVEIKEYVKNIFNTLMSCSNINHTLAALNCYVDVSTNITINIFTIANKSSEEADSLKECIRKINLKTEQCCRVAQRIYASDTALHYNNLHICLEGNTHESTDIVTTPATDTTEAPNVNTTLKPNEPLVYSVVRTFSNILNG